MEIQEVMEVREERIMRLSATGRYSRDVDGKEMLPSEEICSLAKNRNLLSRNKIVESHLRLVIKTAREKMGRTDTHHMKLGDFIQEGNIGLIKAAEKFDPDKGYFLPYAKKKIGEEIYRTIENFEHTIRVPVHRQEDIVSLKRTRGILAKKLGREPKIEEVAVAMEVEVDYVKFLEDTEIFSSETSLDVPVGNSEGDFSTLGDLIPSDETGPFSSFAEKETREILISILSSLTEQEKQVILLRYGFEGEEYTLEYVGEKFELSKERIRQIEAKALIRLRKKNKLKELYNSMS